MKNKKIQEMAKQWLIINDAEAAEFWQSQPDGTNFFGAYKENIRDYGKDNQEGDESMLKFLARQL